NAGVWLAAQLRDNRISELDAAGAMRSYAARAPLNGHAFTLDEALHVFADVFHAPARQPWRAVVSESKEESGLLLRAREEGADPRDSETTARLQDVAEVMGLHLPPRGCTCPRGAKPLCRDRRPGKDRRRAVLRVACRRWSCPVCFRRQVYF